MSVTRKPPSRRASATRWPAPAEPLPFQISTATRARPGEDREASARPAAASAPRAAQRARPAPNAFRSAEPANTVTRASAATRVATAGHALPPPLERRLRDDFLAIRL